MDGIIKVDPQKLISTADDFEGTSQQVKGLTDRMLELARGLNSKWEGDAANAYTTKFNALDEDMNQIYRMIQEHVKDLGEMAQQYITAENANVEAGNALLSDVIS